MRYQQNLQVMLRDRLRRLMQTKHTAYGHEVRLTREWIGSQPALRAITRDLESEGPDVPVDAWLAQCEMSRGVSWPTSTETARARLIWAWMRAIPDDANAVPQFAYRLSNKSNMNDVVRDVTGSIVDILFSYFEERLSTESNVLHLLERYVRRVEWFRRDALYERYSANTQQGEAVYDTDLREWLFDQGLDMPFTQARSASGLSDVLADLNSEDPLVCEVKLYDAKNHAKREIAGGLQQAVSYALDYGKTAAYLMIINLSGRPLNLPSDTAETVWPPYVEVSGVRVHMIAVRALPTVSASKVGPLKPVAWTRDDLINPDA